VSHFARSVDYPCVEEIAIISDGTLELDAAEAVDRR
jgi:hypothetical protein